MKSFLSVFVAFVFFNCKWKAEANQTGVTEGAPALSFYIGIGEGSFGEDPHPVHGTQTSDGGYVVGGKSLDALRRMGRFCP